MRTVILIGLIITIVLAVVVLLYIATTNSIIQEQEEELKKLKGRRTTSMGELEMLRFVVNVYEAELKKRMPEDEFVALVENTAKEAFFKAVDNMPSDFRSIIMDNFDAITGTEEDYQKLMDSLDEEGES